MMRVVTLQRRLSDGDGETGMRLSEKQDADSRDEVKHNEKNDAVSYS